MSDGLTLAKLVKAREMLDEAAMAGVLPDDRLLLELRGLSPRQVTAIDWKLRPRDHALEWYEAQYRRVGYVFSTPDVYVMGRPVRRGLPMEDVIRPKRACSSPDCWFIFLLTGDLGEAVKLLPYPLPWIAWQRDADPTGRLRFYRTERVLALGKRLTARGARLTVPPTTA